MSTDADKKAQSAVIADISKPHDLKHTTPVVQDGALLHAKLERQIKSPHELKHVPRPSDDLNKDKIAEMFESEKAAVLDPRDVAKDLNAELTKPHELKHVTPAVHDAGLARAKLDGEIKAGRRGSLKHVPSPKEGLSKEQLAALIESDKEEKAATAAPAKKA